MQNSQDIQVCVFKPDIEKPEVFSTFLSFFICDLRHFWGSEIGKQLESELLNKWGM